MNAVHLPLIAVLFLGMFYSVYTRKLTVKASVCGALLAYIIYLGTGYAGVTMMTVFFILGSWATGWKHKIKVGSGLAHANKEQRVVSQVLANAGVPAAAALIALIWPSQRELSALLLASGFASAASDTLSSELGNVYGSRFYNILTLKKDIRGENGVISVEGCLAGLVGSAAISMVYACFAGWTRDVLLVLVAGMLGNFFDSVLGASMERKHLIGNDAVNFLNTFFAAALAGLIMYLTGSEG